MEQDITTPYYLVDAEKLEANLRILHSVGKRAGCKILLAQKAFSLHALYPLIGQYLDGTAASGLHEARLGHEEMGGETHVFAAAYRPDEMDELLGICDHLVFNSFTEWERYREKALGAGKRYGIRVNPEHSTQNNRLYDPCAPGSRLGVTAAQFRPDLLHGITGLHFHTLCEQNSDALVATLDVFERKFGRFLPKMEWVNMGGGHHITRADYDTQTLIDRIARFRETHGLDVYLEPGEAVALNAGFLVSAVLDVVENGVTIAILDASATCHMPDVLEVPYRPKVSLVPPGGRVSDSISGEHDAGCPGEKAHTVRLAGPTCLAGDVIGDYSFARVPSPGDQVVFHDMAVYSMVKNNTFNGIWLPSIAIKNKDPDCVQLVKSFGYQDFKERLS